MDDDLVERVADIALNVIVAMHGKDSTEVMPKVARAIIPLVQAHERERVAPYLRLIEKAATIQAEEVGDTRQLLIQFDKVLRHVAAVQAILMEKNDG